MAEGSAKRRRTTGRSSDGSDAGTPASSASTPTPDTVNPLGLEGDSWTPPEEPAPADADVDQVDYVPAPPELIEWTPERAATIVRGGGFLIHTADSAAKLPGGEELWRATEADVDAIAPPLARILNRYDSARRLAGVSDEMELAFGMIGYMRANLATRGRVVTAAREHAEHATAAEGTAGWAEPPA